MGDSCGPQSVGSVGLHTRARPTVAPIRVRFALTQQYPPTSSEQLAKRSGVRVADDLIGGNLGRQRNVERDSRARRDAIDDTARLATNDRSSGLEDAAPCRELCDLLGGVHDLGVERGPEVSRGDLAVGDHEVDSGAAEKLDPVPSVVVTEV